MAKQSVLDAYKNTSKSEEAIDASKKLRVGIIGTGWIAEAHIRSYLKQPDVEIVAGADLIPGKAAAFFRKFGVENVKTEYKDHAEMLADKSLKLDAVSVCTYNRTHAVCAIDSLNAGVNVLLEKPMCVTLDEAVAIMRAEKKSGKVLSIGFQPRLDENMKMIKKIADRVTSRFDAIAVLRFPMNLTRNGAANMPMPEAVPMTRESIDCMPAFFSMYM